MTPDEASAIAFLKEIEVLPPEDQSVLKQKYFEQRIKPSQTWTTTPADMQQQVAQRFGVEMPPPESKGPFIMSKTKQALKPFLPETTAENVRDIWRNPQATMGERMTVTGAHALGYPYAAGKAITPDIARGRLEGLGSFFPQGRSVIGAMGEDIGERIGGPLGGTIGSIAGYGGSYFGKGGIADKIPLLRQAAQSVANRTMSMPTFANLLRAIRSRGGGQPPPATGMPMPPPSAGAAGAPSVEAGLASPYQQYAGNALRQGAERMKVRYGPGGIEIVP